MVDILLELPLYLGPDLYIYWIYMSGPDMQDLYTWPRYINTDLDK